LKTLAVLALVLSCASAYAKEGCKGEVCYDFAEPDWSGWTEDACPINAGCNNAVVNGWGRINVKNYPPNPEFEGNNTRLAWTEAGEGFLSASATISFTGDNGHTGWIEQLNDGVLDYHRCHWDTHAPRASNEVLRLNVLDRGDSRIGVGWGGDELSWGYWANPHSELMPQPVGGYTVAWIVQEDADGIHVLFRAFLPPMQMGENGTFGIELRQDDDGVWWARGTWQRAGVDPFRYDAEVSLAHAPLGGGYISLDGEVPPAPYCVYYAPPLHSGGMYDRQFSVERVVARR